MANAVPHLRLRRHLAPLIANAIPVNAVTVIHAGLALSARGRILAERIAALQAWEIVLLAPQWVMVNAALRLHRRRHLLPLLAALPVIYVPAGKYVAMGPLA